jgi:hypothetical protein
VPNHHERYQCLAAAVIATVIDSATGALVASIGHPLNINEDYG